MLADDRFDRGVIDIVVVRTVERLFNQKNDCIRQQAAVVIRP